MANSTTNLDNISEAQASKATTANELFDALSPASLFGRRASTSAGLTWGYYGGPIVLDGVLVTIANGTVVLDASDTVYVEATRAGVVSQNGTSFTAGRIPLYTVITGAATVTSYTDHRPWADLPGTTSRLSKSVAGSSHVTLTADEARVDALNFTGILTGSINVIVPDGPQQWLVSNNTTGSFTLTVKTSAGSGVAVTQGLAVLLLADGTNVVGLAAAVGGLQYVAEALNTSSPNGTITAVSLSATQAATNVDLILRQKGSGALQRDVADSTSAGGNKRGTYAVDWQGSRAAAAQAATGNGAMIGGGVKNTASGTNSVVAGGEENTASGSTSVVAGGYFNIASGSFSNSWGHNCTADGYGSTAFGYAANARGLNGVEAFSSGLYANPGEFQALRMTLGARTTNATQTTLDSQSAGSVNTSNQMTLPNSSALVVKGLVVGRQNTTGDTVTWEFTAAIRRGANAAATAMIAACTPVLIAVDAGAATWALAVDADTTNGCLRIRVTGEASKTILWTCLITCVQTQG